MPFDKADVLILADSIASTIQTQFETAEVQATHTREYHIEKDAGAIAGLFVNVFPLAYADEEQAATRKEEILDVSGCIVVADRFKEPGKVPVTWMDNYVNMVQKLIFEPLTHVAYPLREDNVYWPAWVKVTCVYDVPFFRKHKVFWSEIEYQFTRLRVR